MDAQKLKKYLEIRCHAMYSKGVTSIKEFEIAFQDVIEKAYPDKCWWEVTNCQIFMELLETRDPEKVIDSIIAQLKVTDTVEESLEGNNEYEDTIMLDDENGNVYELSVTLHNLSDEQMAEIEETGECEEVYHYDMRQGYVIKQEYFKNCSVYNDETKQFVDISYEEYEAFARYHELPAALSNESSIELDESFSKVAYDNQTLEMLELKVPEEVLKQKEELNQCKEFKDERVKQKPDAKLKELKKLELEDKSVTGEQEVNEGDVEVEDNEVSPKEAAKEVKLNESVAADMMSKLRQEVAKLSDLYSADINIRKEENKIYISAELDYSELYDIAEKLDPIIAEYDADAYFDAEEEGLWVAYFHNLDLNESVGKMDGRPHHRDLLAAINDGFVSYKTVALACLDYMTDEAIADMCNINDFNIGTDFEE